MPAPRPSVCGSGAAAGTSFPTRAGSPTSSSTWCSRARSAAPRPRSHRRWTRSAARPTRLRPMSTRASTPPCIGDDLPRAVDLLSDIVLAPSFDADELERERMVIFERRSRASRTRPEDLVHELFTESQWPDHPLGRPILGTPDTVAGFERDDLVRFFRKTYAPSQHRRGSRGGARPRAAASSS